MTLRPVFKSACIRSSPPQKSTYTLISASFPVESTEKDCRAKTNRFKVNRFKINHLLSRFIHFSTTGRCTGPPRSDVSIRQAGAAAIVTSSFKIFLTQTGATCYIVPSRPMIRLFNGVNFGYHSVEVYRTFSSYLRVLYRIRNFYNGGRY